MARPVSLLLLIFLVISCGSDGTTEDGDAISFGGYDSGGLPENDGVECEPSCLGRNCGDDGCGGSCGKCPAGMPICDNGVCEAECVPDCGGIECGDDGCGGSCGTCPEAAALCVDGVCTPECHPACQGKTCGPDGCGGKCGECSGGKVCDEGNCACVPEYEEDCCGTSVCYYDSCGIKGEKIHSCPIGCSAGVCLLPKKVALYVEGALVGPGDLSGATWDGMGTISDEVMTQAAAWGLELLGIGAGVPGLDMIVGWLGKGLLAQYEPPDPYGTAWFMSDGVWSDITVSLPTVSDSFNPTWFGAGWLNLPLKQTLKVRVELIDEDVFSDDPIGSAIIPYEAIEGALYSGQKFTVPVGDQTFNTIMALVISVHPMGDCQPACSGKDCGDDGCGGSCGVCPEGKVCSADGLCNSGGCPAIWDCIAACAEGDQTCVTACVEAADQEYQDAFWAVIDCLDGNGYYDCPDDICENNALAACDAELKDCFHGDLSCNQVLECYAGCSDQDCYDACYFSGTVAAQEAVVGLYSCLEQACPGADQACYDSAVVGDCKSQADTCSES